MTRVTEWHTWRSHGIGASEVAGVLGISPWSSPYSVWQAKVGGGNNGTSGNAEAMKWGQLLEGAILAEVERRLGVAVAGEQTWCTHRDHEWAIATVDAFYADEPGFAIGDAVGVVEVKTTSDPRWHDVPDHYLAQVQWQLEVCDLDLGWVACLHNGRKLSLWPVVRDRDLGAGMLEVVGDFWARHVLSGEPPAIDGAAATTAAITARFTDTDPETVADLTGYAVDIENLRFIRATIKDLSSTAAEVENRLKAALGPAEAGDVNGVRAVTWKPSTARRVDLDRLRDEHPALAAEITVESTTRRFLLKGPPP